MSVPISERLKDLEIEMRLLRTRLSVLEDDLKKLQLEAEGHCVEEKAPQERSFEPEKPQHPDQGIEQSAAQPPPLPHLVSQPQIPTAQVGQEQDFAPVGLVKNPTQASTGQFLEKTMPAGTPQNTDPVERTEGSFELRFGMVWAVRLGVLALLTGLVFLSGYAYQNSIQFWPNWGKAALLYAVSFSLLGLGFWLERGRETLRNFARVLMGGGFGAVYYVTYASHYVGEVKWIESAVVCASLLILLAGAMVWFADRRRSAILGTVAVSLAYYSVMVGQSGWASPVVHLALACAAVVLMLRNSWQVVPYLALVATYLGYFLWVGGTAGEATWELLYLGAYWGLFLFAALYPARGQLPGISRALLILINTVCALFLLGNSAAENVRDQLWPVLALASGVCGSLVLWSARNERGLAVEQVLLLQCVLLGLLALASWLDGLLFVLVLGAVTLLLRYGVRFERYCWLLGILSVVLGLISAGGSLLQLGWSKRLDTDFLLRLILTGMFLAGAFYRLPKIEYRVQIGALMMSLYSAVLLATTLGAHLRDEWAVFGWAVAGLALGVLAHKLRRVEVMLASVLLGISAWVFSLPVLDSSATSWGPWPLIGISMVTFGHVVLWERLGSGAFSPTALAWFSRLGSIVLVGWIFAQADLRNWVKDWGVWGPILAVISVALGGALRNEFFALTGQWFSVVGFVSYLLNGGNAPFYSNLTSFTLMWPIAIWAATRAKHAVEGDVVKAFRYGPAVAGVVLAYHAFAEVESKWLPVTFSAGGLLLAGSCIWRMGTGRLIYSLLYSALSVLSFFLVAWEGNSKLIIHGLAVGCLIGMPYALRFSGFFESNSGWSVLFWLTSQLMALFWLATFRDQVSLALLWAGWGFLMIILGLVTRERSLRLFGLGVIILSLGHVVFVDAWSLGTLQRVFAFMGVGILLVALGYLYNRFQDNLRKFF